MPRHPILKDTKIDTHTERTEHVQTQPQTHKPTHLNVRNRRLLPCSASLTPHQEAEHDLSTCNSVRQALAGQADEQDKGCGESDVRLPQAASLEAGKIWVWAFLIV